MITPNNEHIYQYIYQEKALTEQLLGSTSYSFPFMKATYKATFTDAADLTLFDKVICDLLQVEDILSFEEIAYMLGLNVIHRPEEGIYIDYAEKEILEAAITSLRGFQMIDTGDSKHSRCSLTPVGKKYATQGKKILPAKEKKFDLLFDLTDFKNVEAKKRFGTIEAAFPTSTVSEMEEKQVANEELVRAVAAVQIPEQYAPEELRNLLDVEFLEVRKHSAEFTIVGLSSMLDNTVRFLAFDAQQKPQPAIGALIKEQEHLQTEILDQLLLHHQPDKEPIPVQRYYKLKAVVVQDELQKLTNTKKLKQALQKSKAFYLATGLVEQAFLELNLDLVFDKNSKEYWLFLPVLNAPIMKGIESLINKQLKAQHKLVVLVPEEINEEYQAYFSSCFKKHPAFFFGTLERFEELDSPLFLSKNGNEKAAWAKQIIPVEIKTKQGKRKASRATYLQQTSWEEATNSLYKTHKKIVALNSIEQAQENITQQYTYCLNNPDSLSLQEIDKISQQSKKLMFFEKVKELNEDLDLLRQNCQAKIIHLQSLLLNKAKEALQNVQQEYQGDKNNFNSSQLRIFEDQLSYSLTGLVNKKSPTALQIKALLQKIQPHIQTLSDAKKASNKRKAYSSTNKKR